MNLVSKPNYHRWRPGACLRVTGEDTLSFLQGQFTNDLHQSGNDGAVYGLWLNQKGKVLADSFVRRVSEREAWIVSYFSTVAVLLERLEAYIIPDDVVIEDRTTTLVGLTLCGDPPADLGLGADGWSFRGRRMREPHTEFIFPLGEALAVNAKLTGGDSLTAEAMERARITAGIPAVPVDIGPTDLPNEGGLETGAISYTKGCYLGQEVMARLKSMGQVRRRLMRVRGSGGLPPRPAALFQGARKVGELRSAVREGDSWIGLAMVSLVQLKREQGLSVAADAAPVMALTDAP